MLSSPVELMLAYSSSFYWLSQKICRPELGFSYTLTHHFLPRVNDRLILLWRSANSAKLHHEFQIIPNIRKKSRLMTTLLTELPVTGQWYYRMTCYLDFTAKRLGNTKLQWYSTLSVILEKEPLIPSNRYRFHNLSFATWASNSVHSAQVWCAPKAWTAENKIAVGIFISPLAQVWFYCCVWYSSCRCCRHGMIIQSWVNIHCPW